MRVLRVITFWDVGFGGLQGLGIEGFTVVGLRDLGFEAHRFGDVGFEGSQFQGFDVCGLRVIRFLGICFWCGAGNPQLQIRVCRVEWGGQDSRVDGLGI